MNDPEIEREKALVVQMLRAENLRFASWVVDLLEQFYKADNFGLAASLLREIFRKQILECEANAAVLEAERDGSLGG